jgi:D-alanine-D-alanine ligase-like ATP-grasp enzyme
MVGCEEVTSDVLSQVKPTRAGSSIGVVVAYGVNDAAQKAEEIISKVQNTF